MAPHSSVLAWRIPETGEPGGLLYGVAQSWTRLKRLSSSKNTQKNCTKDLHDPDSHDGVITHLEPDILECELKWALGSITRNKVSGGDGIVEEMEFQLSYFKF